TTAISITANTSVRKINRFLFFLFFFAFISSNPMRITPGIIIPFKHSDNYDYCLTFLAASRRICFTSRSEEHTSELQSRFELVCRLLLEKKNKNVEHIK